MLFPKFLKEAYFLKISRVASSWNRPRKLSSLGSVKGICHSLIVCIEDVTQHKQECISK